MHTVTDTFHGFIADLSKNQYFTVDYPGSIMSGVSGITNAGHLTGSYQDTNFKWHGFIGVPK
jgi:hypothetical protein